MEFLDVGAAGGDGGRKFADDSGAVVAGDGDMDGGEWGGFRVIFADGLNDKAGNAGGFQVGKQGVNGFLWGIDTDQAGELTGEARHAAFLPTAVVAGDGFGKGLDQAGAVGAENGHDDGVTHGGIGSDGGVDSRTKRGEWILFLPRSLWNWDRWFSLHPQYPIFMASDNPFQSRFQSLGHLPTHHAESVNLAAYRRLSGLLIVPLDHAGRCVLLRAPRAGFGKTHLLARLCHFLGASHEFVAVKPGARGVVDTGTLMEDVLMRLTRNLPAALGMTVLDLVARRLLAMALQPLVRSGEVPCHDRDGVLSALQTRPVETFDFHHPNATTAHWAKENFVVLGPRLSLELAQRTGLPVADVAIWLDALFRYASAPMDYPARGAMLLDGLRSVMAAGGLNLLVALLVMLTHLTRVVLIVDDLEGYSADEEGALRLASFLVGLHQSVERMDVVFSVNQDVWENAFLPRIGGGLEDRLSEEIIDLEPLGATEVMDLLKCRTPVKAEELLRAMEKTGVAAHARGVIRGAGAVWENRGDPGVSGRIVGSVASVSASPAGKDAPMAQGWVMGGSGFSHIGFAEHPERLHEFAVASPEVHLAKAPVEVSKVLQEPTASVDVDETSRVDELLRRFRERHGKGNS